MNKLEFRIASTHVGKGMIQTSNLPTQGVNPYWSYARHLPENYDKTRILRRRTIGSRLLENLKKMGEKQEIDLTPLRDDQRASGVIYGINPLQGMYDLIAAYACRFPDHQFHGKWGGGQEDKQGKGFAFYLEDEADVARFIVQMKQIAFEFDRPLKINHRYGFSSLRHCVEFDELSRATLLDRKTFESLLVALDFMDHFADELFD